MPVRPVLTPDLLVTALDEEGVVFDPATDQAHNLTPTAFRVFTAIDGASTDADMAAALDLPLTVVQEALAQFSEAGLLVEGFSRRVALQRGAALTGLAVAAPMLLSLSAPPAYAATSVFGGGGGGPAYLFFTDFESGNPFNDPTGSGVLTTAKSSSPTHSLSFTALGSGGDGFTAPFGVTTGQSLTFTTDYASDGDGGFLGINFYSDAGGTNSVGEQWLFGDARYPATTVLPTGPSPFNTYTATFVIPAGVASIRLKAEDYGGPGAGVSNDPANNPVYFDNIGFY